MDEKMMDILMDESEDIEAVSGFAEAADVIVPALYDAPVLAEDVNDLISTGVVQSAEEAEALFRHLGPVFFRRIVRKLPLLRDRAPVREIERRVKEKVIRKIARKLSRASSVYYYQKKAVDKTELTFFDDKTNAFIPDTGLKPPRPLWVRRFYIYVYPLSPSPDEFAAILQMAEKAKVSLTVGGVAHEFYMDDVIYTKGDVDIAAAGSTDTQIQSVLFNREGVDFGSPGLYIPARATVNVKITNIPYQNTAAWQNIALKVVLLGRQI